MPDNALRGALAGACLTRNADLGESPLGKSHAHRKWMVLAGLMLVYAASNGIVFHTLPILYPTLIEHFDWSTSEVSIPATAFLIFGAVTTVPAGVLLDRHSPRLILTFGSAGVILGLALLSMVTELWHVVAVYLLFGVSLSLCGLTASMVVLTRWFDTNRGRATGILLMSSSLGAAIFPLLLGYGIEVAGWRGALLFFSAISAILTLVPMAFLIRNSPETKMLNEEHEDKFATHRDDPEGAFSKKSPASAGPTLRETLKSYKFYLWAFSTGAMWFSIVAILQHQSIYMARDVGVNKSLLPSIYSLLFICSVSGKLGFGWIGDSIDKEMALILSIVTFGIGVLMLSDASSANITLLYVTVAILGFGFSGVYTTIQVSLAQQFAGPSYGKILAILLMIDSLAGGLGTSVVARMRDSSGSYSSAFGLMLCLCIAAIICVGAIKMKTPKRNGIGPS